MLIHPCRLTLGEATVAGTLETLTLLPTSDPSSAVYRGVLVPRLARLERTVRSRVFQDRTAPQIVEAVLTEHGIPFESAALTEYPAREYTVQYEESDLAFVQRLLEHWGLFYFFQQQPDGETVVLADDNRAFVAHPS